MNLTVRLLRTLAILLPVGALIFWFLAGANTGWTKTQVPVKTVDEITGIEGVTYEKKFVPGIEFLGVTALASAGLGVVAFILGRVRRKGSESATQ